MFTARAMVNFEMLSPALRMEDDDDNCIENEPAMAVRDSLPNVTQILNVKCLLFITMYSYKNTKWDKNKCARLSLVCSFQI